MRGILKRIVRITPHEKSLGHGRLYVTTIGWPPASGSFEIYRSKMYTAQEIGMAATISCIKEFERIPHRPPEAVLAHCTSGQIQGANFGCPQGTWIYSQFWSTPPRL